MTEYLTTDDVIDLQIRAMHETNEEPQGLRDRGLLESAVMRPQFLAHYQEADLFEQAAALGNGISRSQPFVEGNKRAGYAAVVFFLDLNGYEVTGEPLEFAAALLGAAQPGVNPAEGEAALAAWLREHTAPA